ncbi:CvpA family protein [Lacticaseibacillus brantae]|uniref:Membrane ancor connecting MutS2 with cell-division Z-ring n=1 Tax=Lacticaseibacillus brantae DSM 23927 TaxID=1423727 RepID=A0A0R2AWC1_9LACO|nr:CvpA family protein [Lacticaseibacillus brantae]KRM71549.1 membrane ancor connecting MutS2 with cell-division Z-ring [Lacticaseibacillus brantae DSM 23927]
MLSIIIILVLAYFFYAGARRGLWLQLLHVLGYSVSFFLAALWANPLSTRLTLLVPYPSATEQSKFTFFTNSVGLTLDQAFYRGFAFLFIFALGWLLTRIILLWFHNLTYRRIDPQVNLVTAGGLNLIVGYVLLFMGLYLLALIPVGGIQDVLSQSWVARLMISHTPGLTQLFTQWWILG